jgi:predicted Zn-ribbon and HTH transcriptional regulator
MTFRYDARMTDQAQGLRDAMAALQWSRCRECGWMEPVPLVSRCGGCGSPHLEQHPSAG